MMWFCFVWLLLLSAAAQDAPDAAPELEEDLQEAIEEQSVRELLERLEEPRRINLRPGFQGVFVLEAPRNGSTFPDLLITLAGVDPLSNTDLYCKPGGGFHVLTGDIADLTDFVWKSDHRHGLDYVFISRHHPRYTEFVAPTDGGVDVAYFACSVIEEGWDSAIVTMEIDADYVSRNLVEEEQAALQSIFEECCDAEDECIRWKEHNDQNNAEATDFCHFEGSICNSDGNLIRLNLDGMNMDCTFPGEYLTQFPFLEKLQLKGNPFRGRLSDVLEQIAEFENLDHLSLEGASFRGDLDADGSDSEPAICALARSNQLRDLEITNCSISGRIPECIFDEDSRLTAINLGHNQLTGELPAVDLSDSSLINVLLNGNELSGELPVEWTTSPSLQWLQLSNNQLTGELPEELGSMEALQMLWLGGNQFTGSLPPEIIDAPALRELNVSHNQLSGELTVAFNNVTQLFVLALGHNNFTGRIPPGFANASQLIFLEMDHNQFTGEIPLELGMAPNLLSLSLQYNQLTGSLPLSFARLVQLQGLFLNSNELTGWIPVEWGFMYNLALLGLHDNQLEGDIPGWMLQTAPLILANRLAVNLHNNAFTGFDESWYANTTVRSRLVEFDASRNQIEGEVPPNLVIQDTLLYLDLSGNEMSGPLPAEIGALERVLELNLSSNAFTGEIPLEWSVISLFNSNLTTVMDLSDNQLTGVLPSFVFRESNSNTEREFYLQGNTFEFECESGNELDFVQDLDCDDSVPLSEQEPARERDESDTVTQFSANGDGTQNVDDMETSSSSSSSVLVPVLATVAAVSFGFIVLLTVILLKSHKSRKQRFHQAAIPMSTLGITPRNKRSDDGVRMLSGIGDSSAEV